MMPSSARMASKNLRNEDAGRMLISSRMAAKSVETMDVAGAGEAVVTVVSSACRGSAESCGEARGLRPVERVGLPSVDACVVKVSEMSWVDPGLVSLAGLWDRGFVGAGVAGADGRRSGRAVRLEDVGPCTVQGLLSGLAGRVLRSCSRAFRNDTLFSTR